MSSEDQKYLNFKFHIKEGEQREILNAFLLNLPLEGLLEEEEYLLAFIQNDQWKRENQQELAEISNHLNIPFSLEEIPFQNWNQIWESKYESITIDDLCVIRAPFHITEVPANATEILISPQMAFGTGHHPTTRLMIRKMKTLQIYGKKILDFGAGSGILSILSRKWGASKVSALEIDPYAVQNLKENVKLNNVDKIKITTGDLIDLSHKKIHIILANVNKNTLIDRAKELKKKCRKKGVLVLSGILKSDEKEVENAFTKSGFKLKDVTQELDWICMEFKKKQ